MQNLKETQLKVYQEVKDLVKEFSLYTSDRDFINHIEKIKNFSEKVFALKIYHQLETWRLEEEKAEEPAEKTTIHFEVEADKISEIEDTEALQAAIDEQYFREKEEDQLMQTAVFIEEEQKEFTQISQTKLKIEEQDEEDRLKQEKTTILEIVKTDPDDNTIELPVTYEAPESKKFRLSHIKGLNMVQSLFDDFSLEEQEVENKKNVENFSETTDASQVLDVLKVEKMLPDFKLDINDKIAFTKMLFNGSQVELNSVITRLNSFQTLDAAKDYLSDVYYDRNWETVDEYAQRLWSLVENKFL